jgi:hypothetical protein
MSLDAEPYRIAVAPVEIASSVGAQNDSALHLGTKEDLSKRFVDALTKMNVASEVKLTPARNAGGSSDADLDFAADGKYDLLLRPRLVRANFTYDSPSSSAFLSGSLWFLTWIGGFFVSDSDYKADLMLECETWNPCTKQLVTYTRAESDKKTTLSYFERNDFFSLGTLESLVVPPFWTHDGTEIASESLTDHGTMQVAADFKRRLRDLANSAATSGATDFPEIEIVTPQNGTTAKGGTTDLTLRITSPRLGIAHVSVFVNGTSLRDMNQGEDFADYAKQRRPDGRMQCEVTVNGLALPSESENVVRILVGLYGDTAMAARSLVIYGANGRPAPIAAN